LTFIDFIPKSGRALLFPVYQEMFQRRRGLYFKGWQTRRDIRIHWVQEMMRSIDYLETREDIDGEKLAVAGLSLGAAVAPLLTALDERLKASVLIGGGFDETNLIKPPEISEQNFVTRIRVPTLMINGRFDFGVSYEAGLIPMFRLLATPEEHKRLAVFDSGHLPPRADTIRETLAWLDRYLGPVETPR
jgi:pimeloyl-ACP methyl ester carboxylesterase